MKLTAHRKQSVHRTPPRSPLTLFVDEFWSYAYASPAATKVFADARSKGKSMIRVVQFVIRKNSGQRVRMVGLGYWEATGESLKKRPRKFLPKQVLRRQVPIDWDAYETKLAIQTLTRPASQKELAFYDKMAANMKLGVAS